MINRFRIFGRRGGYFGRPFSEIAKEVNRVMANPEINGNPVALDFSKGRAATGYSGDTAYANAFDRIFGGRKRVDSGTSAGAATGEVAPVKS